MLGCPTFLKLVQVDALDVFKVSDFDGSTLATFSSLNTGLQLCISEQNITILDRLKGSLPVHEFL